MRRAETIWQFNIEMPMDTLELQVCTVVSRSPGFRSGLWGSANSDVAICRAVFTRLRFRSPHREFLAAITCTAARATSSQWQARQLLCGLMPSGLPVSHKPR